MLTTTVSSKGQIVIPRRLREKHRLTAGVRLQVRESAEGLVFTPMKAKPTPRAARTLGWRSLRGSAKGTGALNAHLAEHRREAER